MRHAYSLHAPRASTKRIQWPSSTHESGCLTTARAVAGVLGAAIALGDGMDVVPEQPAQIADALGEDAAAGIRIGADAEQQRVATADARVLSMPVPLHHLFIGVVAEEAGQRVPDVNRALVVVQECPAAPGARPAAVQECIVVNRVAPEQAEQLGQHDPSHAAMCKARGERLI